MIEIKDKKNCCGCSACVQICPQQCIYTEADKEGFLYPKADTEKCINCGLCERVCPIINQFESHNPLKVYAAFNPDEEIRKNSSSGGVFSALAEYVLDQAGVVFGARFDENWDVIHDFVEMKENMSRFRGSKYVQSDIKECYKEAQHFLKSGRQVLFSGTPCQIAGLKKYLRKEYDKLLTVDVVCHGVPSPRVWNDYKEYIKRLMGASGKNTVSSSLKDIPVITGVSFRDKRNGWKKFGFAAEMAAAKVAKNSVLPPINSFYETVNENLYLQGFIRNLYLRPSCYDCQFKCGKSHSDITLADYWQIAKFYPELDDDKGISLVLTNTENGESVFNALKLNKTTTTYDKGYYGNHSLELSSVCPHNRASFWRDYEKKRIKVIKKHLPHTTFLQKCRIKLKLIFKEIINY